LLAVRKFRTTCRVNAKKPSRRPRGKTKGKPKARAVKRSLSYTPAAWKAIETLAKRRAKVDGTQANYSATASSLVLVGAGNSKN
jgi:hypothetical protein